MSRDARKQPALSEVAPPLSPLLPEAEAAQGVWRWGLPILIALYLFVAVLHLQWVPTGQTGYQNAPDEAAHVQYIRTLAKGSLPANGKLARVPVAPEADLGNNPQGYEWHQPPLYYGLGVLFSGLGDQGLRYLSVICGVVALLLIYQAARLLIPNDPRVAVVATGIAALTPTHIAVSSTVNNDILLEVCFSGTLLILLAAMRGGLTQARAVWLGITVGAAILTKATGLLLLPVVAVGLFLLWRHGEMGRTLARGATWAAMIAGAMSGWWFLRNLQLYGEVLPLQAFQKAFGGTVLAQDLITGKIPSLPVYDWLSYFQLVGQWTFQSFWAVFGTPKSALIGAPRWLPDQLYLLLALMSVAVVAGLTRLHFRRKVEFTEVQIAAIRLLFVVIGLVALAFFGFVVKYFQAQGRYFYPAMLPLCLLGALGWKALFPERYLSLAYGLLLGLLAALTTAFLLAVQATTGMR